MSALAGSTLEDEVSCVLIECHGRLVLIPNVCVAEIVPWRKVHEVEAAPEWLIGLTNWRSQVVPVVHASEIPPEDSFAPRCMVVMNRTRLNDCHPFYAMAASALPRMLQLGLDDAVNETDSLGPDEVMKVRLGTELAVIPDLEFIEQRVAQLSLS